MLSVLVRLDCVVCHIEGMFVWERDFFVNVIQDVIGIEKDCNGYRDFLLGTVSKAADGTLLNGGSFQFLRQR